jgi:RNA recognition motif-containing protein
MSTALPKILQAALALASTFPTRIVIYSICIASISSAFQTSSNAITKQMHPMTTSLSFVSHQYQFAIRRRSSNDKFHVAETNSGKYCDIKTNLFYFDNDADMMEGIAGGQRYSMVELPDSMVDTTIFVGNLCEFVTDDELSSLFQQVSSLNFVPACVCRKPNMSSLKYGFVTFPTISEKEAAIIRFTGYELNNRKLKVEEIQDYKYRVRVPEKLVCYTVGKVKRTRDGRRNTMRMAKNSRESSSMLSPSSSASRKKRSRGSNRSSVSSLRSHRSNDSDCSSEGRSSHSAKRKRKDRRNRRRKNNNFEYDSMM